MAEARVFLVGCVKRKRAGVHPARDLYVSPLWAARRGYVEQAGGSWFILSALHGLVEPEQPLAGYDLSLRDLPVAVRRRWADGVVAELEQRLGPLAGRSFELHAGGAYRSVIEPLLLARGASVDAPTAQVSGVGRQIGWYGRRAGLTPSRRRTAASAEVEAALHALDDAAKTVPASRWPGDLTDLDQPGLYAWWVDAPGALMLSRGLGLEVSEGRIYVGLTGATKWPSGTTGKHTLAKRVGRNHIRGRVRGSTFRLTLASVLKDELGLVATAPKALTPESEAALTEWICGHLSAAVYPFPEPDALADLESRVLARLDPPLNLDELPATPLRLRLTELRHQLSHEGASRFAAQIGNGYEGYYTVESDGERTVWRGPSADDQEGQVVEELEVDPSTWRAFWRALDRLDVWSWNGHHYGRPDVMDGTYWHVEAQRGSRTLSASGNNGYPGVKGAEPSPEFHALCRAISRVAGDRPFA